MGQVISIDFQRRQVIRGPLTEATARKIEQEPQDMWAQYDRSMASIVARLGDRIAHTVFIQAFNGPSFDTYGHGNCHNSIHQYRGTKNWNDPFPVPADLYKIEKYLKKNQGKVLRLGNKSDPFMWLDNKYSITKFTLELANKYDVELVIHTMSDLCAHNDYLDLIHAGKHQVVMHLGFKDGDDQLERAVSPGAPSLKRRHNAIQKLREAGCEVREEWNSPESLTKAQRKFFQNVTGTTVEGWFGVEA